MDDKKELKQEELSEVNGGGYIWWTVNNKHYKYVGKDESQKYVCPKCGKPVHPGTLDRFYCDPCNESWYFERFLEINLKSGAWREMTEEEYKRYLFGKNWSQKGGGTTAQESQF